MSNKIVFVLIIILFLIVRGIFTLIARGSGLSINFTDGSNQQQKSDKPSLFGILIILIILGLLMFYLLYPTEKNSLIIVIPGWVQIIGNVLCIISIVLQIIIHKAYQDGWQLAKKNNLEGKVITNGPYKWIRHPLYFSLIVFLFGLAMVTAYIPMIILALCSIPLFQREAINEEDEIKKTLASEYDNYCKKTGRLFPKIII
jgi:protein-S-isoprenylcysteine O-methyltransferase Ste14